MQFSNFFVFSMIIVWRAIFYISSIIFIFLSFFYPIRLYNCGWLRLSHTTASLHKLSRNWRAVILSRTSYACAANACRRWRYHFILFASFALVWRKTIHIERVGSRGADCTLVQSIVAYLRSHWWRRGALWSRCTDAGKFQKIIIINFVCGGVCGCEREYVWASVITWLLVSVQVPRIMFMNVNVHECMYGINGFVVAVTDTWLCVKACCTYVCIEMAVNEIAHERMQTYEQSAWQLMRYTLHIFFSPPHLCYFLPH